MIPASSFTIQLSARDGEADSEVIQARSPSPPPPSGQTAKGKAREIACEASILLLTDRCVTQRHKAYFFFFFLKPGERKKH